MTDVPSRFAPNTEIMRELVHDDPLDGWDRVWQKKVTPWDAGRIQPPLQHLIESKELTSHLPPSGRALVPGAGKAYDSVFLAESLDYEVVAIDISPIAIDFAKEIIGASAKSPLITLLMTDFFTYTVPEDKRFNLIYDYTFFVALQPHHRKDWGAQMNALVKPGGLLITLAWPMPLDDAPKDYQGPPFLVEIQDYADVLGGGWEKIVDKVPDVTLSRPMSGKERIVVWKKI